MWEFSIFLEKNKSDIAASIFDILKNQLSCHQAIVARAEEGKFIALSIALPKEKRPEAEIVLLQCITLCICQNYKSEYLDKHLFLPNQDEMSVTAFKKALINFDRETDYFLISKFLNFNEYLYLDSFYQFKLSLLRDKWSELIRLANENRDYLVSTDAFFDLLKFLIDNLDICKGEIDVVEDEDGYHICDEGQKGGALTSKALISNLIDLSPQKINIYCQNENSATDLLKVIFDRRINLLPFGGEKKVVSNLNFFTK